MNEIETRSVFAKYPWLAFVVPFAVYMVLTQLEAYLPGLEAQPADNTDAVGQERFAAYPLAYGAKVALTTIALLIFLPIYRALPGKVNSLAWGIGAIGAVIWVLLVKVQPSFITDLLSGILGGPRPGFDPVTHFDGQQLFLVGFVALRCFGMGFIVPLIEELFLRGFVVRFVAGSPFFQQPFRQGSGTVFLVVIVYALTTHPASESLAAVAWFSLITLLVLRTGNLWDAVAAHSITNLMLAAYVLVTRDWTLW